MTAARSYRRSRFLVLLWEGAELILLHCNNLRRFRVTRRLVELLGGLQTWTTPEELASAGWEIPASELARLVELELIEERTTEEEDGETCWTPIDLAVHRQSNTGGYHPSSRRRHVELGSSSERRPGGRALPLPAAAPLPCQLDEVLSQRRSIRTYGPRPLRLAELSNLLYHAARVAAVVRDGDANDYLLHPFPTAGACSELEIYTVANDVEGLIAGAYYYDARSHNLVRLRERDQHQEQLNLRLRASTGDALNRDPPAVLLITAVFAKVMRKYQGIGLSLIYKDTGGLFQTLYLVATALDLAPCAIGAGPEYANARWLGLDPLVQSEVGCFLVGPRAGVREASEAASGR